MDVEEIVGDCAYGGGNTRQIFADENRKLVAKVAIHGRRDQISKDQFRIDLFEMSCTCPAGQVTHTLISQGSWKDKDGEKHAGQAFRFETEICARCPLRGAASRRKQVGAERSPCILKKTCCKKPKLSKRVKHSKNIVNFVRWVNISSPV
jgi:hypothetical protein